MRSATTPTPAPHAQLRQYQATLQHLAQRLQRLESIRNVSQDAVEDGQAAIQTRAAFTPEEGRAAELAWWEETQRRFEREAVDTPWAAATTPLFAANIAGLGEASGFAPVHTACRASQCVAVLEWPSYGEAVQGYAALLHHPYQANCARHTLLPTPTAQKSSNPILGRSSSIVANGGSKAEQECRVQVHSGPAEEHAVMQRMHREGSIL